MKACSRLLLPLYLVLAVTTILDRIVLYLNIFKGALEIIPVLITFTYVMSIIAIVVVSLVIIVLRFYKNLTTDEGYLMFTLPVKSHQLINSKLYASLIWTVAGLAAVLTSIFAVAATDTRMRLFWEGLHTMSAELDESFGAYKTLLIAEFVLLIIIGIVNKILQVYASVALGQLMHGHKVLGSFVAFIATSIIVQIILTVVTVVAELLFSHNFNDIMSLPKIVLPITIVFFILITAAYYLITNYIFRKKINLD
jgi:hypothetical protein